VRINESTVIRAPREAVWRRVTDPSAYLEFMSGITRWELQGDGDAVARDEPIEPGSRIRMLIQVGSAEVGGLIEVVEFKEGSDLAWSSVTGVDQRGRWRLRDAGNGSTRVELRYSYGVAGAGIAGLVAERVAAPMLRRRLRQSLIGLKRLVERDVRRGPSSGYPAREPALD
jgi:uncharacterized membrane protein